MWCICLAVACCARLCVLSLPLASHLSMHNALAISRAVPICLVTVCCAEQCSKALCHWRPFRPVPQSACSLVILLPVGGRRWGMCPSCFHNTLIAVSTSCLYRGTKTIKYLEENVAAFQVGQHEACMNPCTLHCLTVLLTPEAS